MAFSSTDLTALEAAMKTGTLKVKYQDREVTYQSFEAMQKLYIMMKQQLDETDVPDGLQSKIGTKRVLASYSKGLDASDE